MATPGLQRQQYLLSLGINRILDGRYADLVKPLSVRQMVVTNLRKRPLSPSHLDSMKDLVLSLYHHLVTGSKDFPHVAFRGHLDTDELETTFRPVLQSRRENTTPSPLTDSPDGMVVLPPGSRLTSQILTPVLPDKANIFVLKADRRNCVRTLEVNGLTVNRVISAVYRTEDCDTEMTNIWRVTDYSSEGNVIMSVLCRFPRKFAQRAKRKATEEKSSSRSPAPPRKRFRL
ncbi:unnamed protein product [Oreochromis niloticus]|nr:unnamed protein product [Mustela putorius furo]